MRLLLTSIDTWFFRDATPFDMDATLQAGVRGLFPPSPVTVTGAVRAALARANGWNGREDWSQSLKAVLGDGPDDLGCIAITGPFVIRDGEPIFPMPRHLVGRIDNSGNWNASAILRVGAAEVACDLGATLKLPELANDSDEAGGLDATTRHWVTLDGLRRIVSGDPPEARQIVANDEVWREEPRVGIQRNPDSPTTTEKDSALYSTHHARPRPSIGVGVEITGLPDDWNPPINFMIPFGGESRLAACEAWNFDFDWRFDRAPENRSAHLALIAITPALLDPDAVRGRAVLSPEFPARVVCGCVDRPLRIGGWDSRGRAPLPLRNALAPGTVLFCELAEPATDAQVERGLLRLGERQRFGFGLFAIGGVSAGGRSA